MGGIVSKDRAMGIPIEEFQEGLPPGPTKQSHDIERRSVRPGVANGKPPWGTPDVSYLPLSTFDSVFKNWACLHWPTSSILNFLHLTIRSTMYHISLVQSYSYLLSS